jgi:hypothetical protein
MTLTDRITALAQLTLQDPRRATRVLLAEDVPMPARTGGLLLVAVASAFLASIHAGLQTAALDPISAFMLSSPIRAAVIQWLFLALSVVLIHNVGQAFGGKGSFPDALLVVVWLQLLMLALQLVQFVAFLLSPALAGMIGLAGLVLFFWLMSSFIATGLVLGVVLIAIVGPEAFLRNV